MASQPELIFIAGPQSGQRQVLMTSPAIVGRDPRADISIVEKAVSRQHVRFDLIAQGWVMTNLSSNGTVVNAKRYKSSKHQLLLDTGDTIQIGAETRLLFVGPDDDPDQALRAYREVALAVAAVGAEPDPQDQQADEPIDQLEEVDLEEIDPEAVARQAKIRKYAIGGGIYLLAMIALVAFLMNMRSEEEASLAKPPFLKKPEVAQILEHKYDLPDQPGRAGDMLEKARTYFDRRNDDRGNLFRAVNYFQLYQGYRPGGSFERSEDRGNYNQARRELVDKTYKLYKRAYVATKSGDFNLALQLWNELRAELPVADEKDMPIRRSDNRFFKNVTDFIIYVANLRAQQK